MNGRLLTASEPNVAPHPADNVNSQAKGAPLAIATPLTDFPGGRFEHPHAHDVDL